MLRGLLFQVTLRLIFSVVLNEDKLSNRFGVLTPASGIGEVLVERLKDKGIQFNLNE